ncbi:hypothetical protein CsSME_00033247 [Camellia sinensis var. sinensis]
MLYSGMDYAKETGETAAGTALIPTRFVWPYRGGSVFLCSSFTGWSAHYPMTPVEGCLTVFQTICSQVPSSWFITSGGFDDSTRAEFNSIIP